VEKPKVFAISNEDFDLTIRVFNDTTKQLAQMAVDYSKGKLKADFKKQNIAKNLTPSIKKQIIVRGESGHFQGLYEKDQLLQKYGKIKIYKPILVHILLKTGYSFSKDDVVEIIAEYYQGKLNRELTKKSKRTYAKGYIKYMLEKNLITRDKLYVCRKVNWGETKENELQDIETKAEKKTIDDQKIQKMADDIYKLAKDKNWTVLRRGVDLDEIKKGVPGYSEDEVKLALSRLVRFGKMRQDGPSKIIFY
jgi:hypothetical protein